MVEVVRGEERALERSLWLELFAHQYGESIHYLAVDPNWGLSDGGLLDALQRLHLDHMDYSVLVLDHLLWLGVLREYNRPCT
jgi:hypothetical protein